MDSLRGMMSPPSTPESNGGTGANKDVKDDGTPCDCNERGFNSSRPPKILQHTCVGSPGGSDLPSGIAAGTDRGAVHELKRYIDAALEIQLSALEKRLVAQLKDGVLPRSSSPIGSSRHGGNLSTALLASSPGLPSMPEGEELALVGGAEVAAMLVDGSPSSMELGNELITPVPAGGDTDRKKAEAAKQREVKQRENFMAKYSGKEIFGEREERLTSTGHLKKRRRSRWQQMREEGIVIYPQGAFRTYWDMVSIVLVCWITLFLPFRLAFDVGDSEYTFNVIDLFIDVFFIVDLGLNSITAYYDDGHLVTTHYLILRNYVRTWFFFDVISSFPVDWLILFPPALVPPASGSTSQLIGLPASNSVVDVNDTASFSQLIKIVRILKLLRLLRIARLFRYFARFEEAFSGNFSGNFLRLGKLTIIMFIFCRETAAGLDRREPATL